MTGGPGRTHTTATHTTAPVGSWLWLSFYLQRVQPWQARLRNRRARRGLAIDGGAFRRDMEGLDTPWRLAAWAEAHLEEDPQASWLDPPWSPEITWQRRKGGPADYAALALHALSRHGVTARYLVVVTPPLGKDRAIRGADLMADPLLLAAGQHPGSWFGHVVCALFDAQAGGWLHFSNWGLFGLYPGLDDIAQDISPRWAAYLARDEAFRSQGWRRRPAPTGQAPP